MSYRRTAAGPERPRRSAPKSPLRSPDQTTKLSARSSHSRRGDRTTTRCEDQKRRPHDIRIAPDEYADITRSSPGPARLGPLRARMAPRRVPLADASTHRRAYGTFLEATLVDQSLSGTGPLGVALVGTGTAGRRDPPSSKPRLYGAASDASNTRLSSPKRVPRGRTAHLRKVLEV